MRLKSLTLKAFRSFVSQTRIEFPESGLLLIKGPSGHGKSSILLGIAYALGYSPFSAKDLQSDSTDEEMVVQLELSDPNLLIVRGATSRLEHNGEVVCTSAKDLDKKLEEILGLSAQFRELLTYRDQEDPHRFLKLSQSDANELLCKLLGLTAFDAKIEAIGTKIKELTLEVEKRAGTIDGMEKMLGTAPQKPDLDLEALKLEYDSNHDKYTKELENYRGIVKTLELDLERDLAELKSQRDRLSTQKVVASRSESIKFQIENLEASLHGVLAKLTQHQFQQQSSIKKYNQLKIDLQSMESKEVAFKLELNKNTTELEAIQKGNCFNCQQPWINEKRVTELESKKTGLLQQIEENSQKLERTRIDLQLYPTEPTFTPDTALEAEKARIEAEIRAKKNILAEAIGAEKSAEAQTRSEVLELNSKIAQIQSEFMSKSKALEPKSIELSQKDLKNRILMGEKALADFEKRQQEFLDKFKSILDSKSILAMSRQHLDRHLDALDFVKGFTTKIFGEILHEIGVETNRILSDIPNTSTVSIEFLTEKELNTGKTKSGITPVVRFDGKVKKLKARASGGMKTVIELAVDLALARVVEARTGIGSHFLLLDEALDGLDGEPTESVLTMLSQYAKNGLVVVISHGASTQEAFDRKISVHLDQESHIKWD